LIRTLLLKAEPLTLEGMTPFGRVISGEEEILLPMEGHPSVSLLRVNERPLTFQTIARHLRSAQALLAMGGKEWVLVLAPPMSSRSDLPDLDRMKAFSIRGEEGALIAPGIWHYGPVPITPPGVYVNVEAAETNSSDFHVADIVLSLGSEVRVIMNF
jgi:ureidoglycolate hydrolase